MQPFATVIKKNPKACFRVDIDKGLLIGKQACNCSATYRSVIGFGEIQVVNSYEEKIYGLKTLMSHYTSNAEHQFDDSVLKKTLVLKLIVDSITGKKKVVKY